MYIDLGRQPHNEFSMEWYAVQVPWNYRYDDDSCARFGESNAFSLYRVGFAGIRNGEIRHGGLLADNCARDNRQTRFRNIFHE